MKNKDSVELIEYTKAQDALNCATHALGAIFGAAERHHFPLFFSIKLTASFAKASVKYSVTLTGFLSRRIPVEFCFAVYPCAPLKKPKKLPKPRSVGISPSA